jgi:hypothetical protein
MFVIPSFTPIVFTDCSSVAILRYLHCRSRVQRDEGELVGDNLQKKNVDARGIEWGEEKLRRD